MRVPTSLVGRAVERIALDYQVRLLLTGYPPDHAPAMTAELIIGSSFRLRDCAGRWHVFDLDAGTNATLAPMLNLFKRIVSHVEVRGQGQLRVTFDDGAALYVDPDPNHESWELHGEGVEGILVGPGGHAEWDPPTTPA
jgi:hypothetical protein